MSQLKLNKQTLEGITVIEVDGVIDPNTATKFQDAIQEEINARNFRLVVDCAGLSFISSAGIGVFMSFLEEVRERNGDIKICNLDQKGRMLFEILGFLQIQFFDSQVDAVESQKIEKLQAESGEITAGMEFSITVPSDMGNLTEVREFISTLSLRIGFSELEAGKIEVAVTEAYANIVEHAYQFDGQKKVIVTAQITPVELVITLIDTGRGYDPSKVQEKEIQQLIKERNSGGVGMRLIRFLMDEVHYTVIPGQKNELRLVKRRHAQG